jgi:hypothetical protein
MRVGDSVRLAVDDFEIGELELRTMERSSHHCGQLTLIQPIALPVINYRD